MTTNMGLWIDHRQALIVRADPSDEVKRVESNMEKHVRYSGVSEASGAGDVTNDTTEDGRDRRFEEQLNRYYDRVIAVLRDADTILIMGPGEAKRELHKRLQGHGLSSRVAGVMAADKMTEPQLAAAVRQYFDTVEHR